MPDDATPTNPPPPDASGPAGGAPPPAAPVTPPPPPTPPPTPPPDTLNFAKDPDPNQVVGAQTAKTPKPPAEEKPYDPGRDREAARGDLARGLLWLLGFTVAGVLAFVALGRIDGAVIAQSIFPSLIALAGTALGFYFGTQAGKPGG